MGNCRAWREERTGEQAMSRSSTVSRIQRKMNAARTAAGYHLLHCSKVSLQCVHLFCSGWLLVECCSDLFKPAQGEATAQTTGKADNWLVGSSVTPSTRCHIVW